MSYQKAVAAIVRIGEQVKKGEYPFEHVRGQDSQDAVRLLAQWLDRKEESLLPGLAFKFGTLLKAINGRRRK